MATAQAQLLQQHIGGLIVLGVLQLPAVLTLPSSRCIETVVSPMPLLFSTPLAEEFSELPDPYAVSAGVNT